MNEEFLVPWVVFLEFIRHTIHDINVKCVYSLKR